MKISVQDSYEALGKEAGSVVIRELKKKKNLLLCAATGSTPDGPYSFLINEYRREPELFAGIRIIKLDEWGGIPIEDPGTCESYLQEHLIKPLHIDDSRYISFRSNPDDPVAECSRIQNQLDKMGGIDVCIAGLGMNGHIALNEPADFLEPDIHMAALSPQSLMHSMVSGMDKKPSFGLTLGMKAILASKLILVLINGAHKRKIAGAFLSGKVTTRLPASFLWLHPNTLCFIDKEAYSR